MHFVPEKSCPYTIVYPNTKMEKTSLTYSIYKCAIRTNRKFWLINCGPEVVSLWQSMGLRGPYAISAIFNGIP